MSSWGGSVQQIDGVWHMWAVLLINHCGIESYLMNSAVVHAVSSSAVGPYTQKETVLPPCVGRVAALAPPRPPPAARAADLTGRCFAGLPTSRMSCARQAESWC